MFLVRVEVSALSVRAESASDRVALPQSSGEATGCSALPAVGDGTLRVPERGTRSSWPPWRGRPGLGGRRRLRRRLRRRGAPLPPSPGPQLHGADNKAAAAAAAQHGNFKKKE